MALVTWRNSTNSGRGRLVLLLALAFASPACLYRPAPGEVVKGQASGSFTAGGKTVKLKYAYAAPRRVSGMDFSIRVVLTDLPLLRKVLIDKATFLDQGSKELWDGEIMGIAYDLENTELTRDLYFRPGKPWTDGTNSFSPHDGHFQTIKHFSIQHGRVVKGEDEGSSTEAGVEYRWSVSFVAPLPTEKR